MSKKEEEKSFSWTEKGVALFLLALLLTGVYRSVSGQDAAAEAAAQMEEAIALARSVMATAGEGVLRPGREEGAAAGGLRWVRHIRPSAETPGLWEVVVTVTWPSLPEGLTLRSLRPAKTSAEKDGRKENSALLW
ncbi:hypothetical protein [Telmatospirillum sp. J64-1]|uniref:hypothetical protein n=1 Tax=Telmatospirillum sp. J64-1 TaxID=2502183 RepID=UPI00115C95E5|nr:hypothetical protein [Telmatospirillum sp. J64-1]